MVNGLLQLANIESLKDAVEKGRLNIVDVLLDTISFFKLKKPDQEFLLEVSEKFSKETHELEGNAQLLRTAFINLIDNASKYSGAPMAEYRFKSPTRVLVCRKKTWAVYLILSSVASNHY